MNPQQFAVITDTLNKIQISLLLLGAVNILLAIILILRRD